MKRILIVTLLLASLSALSACGSKYSVTTNGGDNYTATSRPEYVEESQTYVFESADGKEVIIKREDIKEIRQAD